MNQRTDSLNLEKNTVQKLQKLGYVYVDKNKFKELAESGVIAKESWASACAVPKTKTASELYEEELEQGCVLSGIKDLDAVLEDEVVAGAVVEFAGLPGTGRTQICFHLCVSVQLEMFTKNVGEAVYIGTNKNFSTKRLREVADNILNRYNIKTTDCDTILKHIHYVEVNNLAELFASLVCMEKYIVDKNVKILIIDSFTHPLKVCEHAERKNTIAKIFEKLRKLSTNKFAVVITNDVTTRINDNGPYQTPSFGGSFYHQVNTRIILSRKSQDILKAEIVKSILKRTTSVSFSLNPRWINKNTVLKYF